MANKAAVTEIRLRFPSALFALHHSLVTSTWALQSHGALSIQHLSSGEKYIGEHTPLTDC